MWLKRVMVLLPILGAAAMPLFVAGEYSWIAKAVMGFLLGSSFSVMLLRRSFVPPYSTVMAATAALLMFASVCVLAANAPGDPLGTVMVGGLCSGAFFWALTRT